MAKLYVAFAGLMGVTDDGIVLVRECSRGTKVGKKEHPIPPHRARVAFTGGEARLGNSATVSFDIKESEEGFDIKDGILRITDLIGGSVAVNKECREGTDGCKANLAARIVGLRGSLKPLALRFDNREVRGEEGAERIVYGRHDPDEDEDKDFSSRTFGEGFLLEARAPGLVMLTVEGQPPVTLTLATEEELRRIGKAPEQAYVVWVENLPLDHDHGRHEPRDFHFYLLYHFLDGKPTRLVPMVRLPKKVAPGSQCISGRLS